jgi:hypothetical protein
MDIYIEENLRWYRITEDGSIYTPSKNAWVVPNENTIWVRSLRHSISKCRLDSINRDGTNAYVAAKLVKIYEKNQNKHPAEVF